jgi:putative oxidoreductase
LETLSQLPDWAALLLRLELGVLFILHGRPKLGSGKQETIGLLSSKRVPFPHLVVLGLGLLEVFGGVLLILGLLTRLVAVLIAIEMFVAAWFISGKGFVRGADWPFTLATSLAALALLGSGHFALDRLVW